ncbi:twin-arginine translocase TatA/TatE family subunit [bacterium]|nr:twin-arginine translocase TatA/TatE family subunit [bacterium]
MIASLLLYIPGHWEIIIIVFAILLLFGGRKIPEMMRGLGTGVKEFRKGIKDDDDSSKKEIDGKDKESKE